MEIVENWSRLAGTVEEWHPPKDPNASATIVIRVDDVGDVRKGDKTYPNLLATSIGNMVRVQVPNVDAHGLKLGEGMHVELEVRRGRSAARLFARPATIRVTR
jgi:hypothetical protein